MGGGALLDALFLLPYVLPWFPSLVAGAVSFETMILLSIAMVVVGVVLIRKTKPIQFRHKGIDLENLGLSDLDVPDIEEPRVQPAYYDPEPLHVTPQPHNAFTGEGLTPVQAGLAAAIMRALSTVDVTGKCVLENIEVPLYGDKWKIEKLEIIINNKQSVQPPVQKETQYRDLSDLRP